MLNYLHKNLLPFIGFEGNTTSHVEKLVSAAGGLIGIGMVIFISRDIVGMDGAALLVASMGASVVLVFSVPHGPLSQPWQLIGGHTIAAFIGVTIAMWVPGILVPGALAVSLTIVAMHYLRCVHPPGGGTALAAVIGGPAVHALGYRYVITPVLLNASVILLAAIAVNYAFPWRRYPAKLRLDTSLTEGAFPAAGEAQQALSHADLEFALRKMNLYVDVTEEDLSRIFQLARGHQLEPHLPPDQVKRGHFYSNGKYDERWAVYEVVEESGTAAPDRDRVIFKIVAGKARGESGIVTRGDFAQLVQYEVFRIDHSWQRAAGEEDKART